MVKKDIAKESIQTKRARNKLKNRLYNLDILATEDAIQKKIFEIKNRIDRNSFFRVALKCKNIALFDENKHSKKLSEKIILISENIQKKYF